MIPERHMRQEQGELFELSWLFLGDTQWKRCRVKPSKLEAQVSLSCPLSSPNPPITSAPRAASLNFQPLTPKTVYPPCTDGRARGRQGMRLKMCPVSDSWLGSFFDLVLFICFNSGWYCLPLCLHTNSMTSFSEYALIAFAHGMVLRDPVENQYGFCPMILN